MLDVLADVPRPAMLRDAFGLEEDGDEFVVGAHDDLLRSEPPRNGVAIAIERDAEHLGDAHSLDVVGVERRLGDPLEQSPLFVLEDELRDLASDLVDATVGEVVAPSGGLRVEIEQIAEAAAGPESSPDETDRSLDAALLIGLSHVAGAHGEAAAGACVFEELRIEDGGGRGMRRHDGLHVVEDVDEGRSRC